MTPFASGSLQDGPTSRRGLFTLAGIGAVSLLTACGDGPTLSTAGTASPSGAGARPAMTVSKDVSCGCCNGWVDHMRDNGFAITTEHPDNLATVWTEHDIPLDLQSCHLGLTAAGDIVVGHVPARHVLEYLADPPSGSRGLSVPQMPVGTPGMEQGDQFDPYDIMLITDGEPEVFARVTTASQQV